MNAQEMAELADTPEYEAEIARLTAALAEEKRQHEATINIHCDTLLRVMDERDAALAEAREIIRAFADHNYWHQTETGWVLSEYSTPPYVEPQVWLAAHSG